MRPATETTCIDAYEWPNRAGDSPAVALSARPGPYGAHDAAGLCASVGKRLCTRAEWTGACRAARARGLHRCNAEACWRSPDWTRVAAFDREHLEQLDQRVESGSCGPDDTVAHDLVGNVAEWVACGSGCCLQGGYWAEPRGCERSNTAHACGWHGYFTGTRCCLDLEQAPELGPGDGGTVDRRDGGADAPATD